MSKQDKKISDFPSKKVIIITFLVLLGYLLYNFVSSEDKNFWQSNYAWNQLEVIHDFGLVQILDHSYDHIKFSKTGSIAFPENEHVLKVTAHKEDYYLCYSNIVQKKESLKFVSGFWLTDQPPNKVKTAKIQIIDLPLIQDGTTTVEMIIDSQLMWHDSRNFRKWLAEKDPDLKFVGTQKDMYGFPYTGGIRNTVERTLKHKDELKKADIYMVQLGTHESKYHQDETLKNFKRLIHVLNDKNKNADIYLITTPPFTNQQKNKRIKKLNAGFKKLAGPHVHIVDFYSLMQQKEGTVDIAADGEHYKTEAYKLLSKKMIRKINEVKSL